jgi:O-antigen/teichoic acid export membrane protein
VRRQIPQLELFLSEGMLARFGASLIANLLRGGLTFVSGILIARQLGAAGYGDLNFLLGTFVALSQLLEMGTSAAFYTFISRKRRGAKFFLFYVGWLIFQFVAVALLVGLVLPADVLRRIFVEQPKELMLLALTASFFMTQMWGMVSQLGEATRKTRIVQAAAVLQAIVHLALVALAVYWNWLSVQIVLALLIGEYFLLAVTLGPRMLSQTMATEAPCDEDVKAVAAEFITYCKPLVAYVWVGFVYTFADRWMLQQFGGAEEQGYFAVGQQFANISLIASISVLKVFWKEIAEARERGDEQRVRWLYHSTRRGFYCVAALLSCLLIPYSQEILGWTVGAAYSGAALCLALMFLYPIHQSLGQIQGIFFYASGETGTHARIGLLMMGISLPITYFMLAPQSAIVPGLAWGAVGLAAKLVILQILGISLQAYVIARSNRWGYDYAYQGVVLGMLIMLAWGCKWVSAGILGLAGSFYSPLAMMLLGSTLYVAGSLAVFLRFPFLAGLTSEQVVRIRTALQSKPRSVVA